MRISDWSSDVCSSDLHARGFADKLPVSHPTPKDDSPAYDLWRRRHEIIARIDAPHVHAEVDRAIVAESRARTARNRIQSQQACVDSRRDDAFGAQSSGGSEEHTSELPSLIRSSYAVFRLKKKQ